MNEAFEMDSSIEALISKALTGEEDDEAAWEAIGALHRRGDLAVFEAATNLLHSTLAKERGRGVDILGQLSNEELKTRCGDALIAALSVEQVPSVIHSIGVALGHLRDPRAVAGLIPFVAHPSDEVRFGVVFGMIPHADPAAVNALVTLSSDPDDDVRDWATFALGTNEDVDTPALREALLNRLNDSNEDVRAEAISGLALRKESRVREALVQALETDSVQVIVVEAAVSFGDVTLLPLLLKLQERDSRANSYFSNVLDDSIAALQH